MSVIIFNYGTESHYRACKVKVPETKDFPIISGDNLDIQGDNKLLNITSKGDCCEAEIQYQQLKAKYETDYKEGYCEGSYGDGIHLIFPLFHIFVDRYYYRKELFICYEITAVNYMLGGKEKTVILTNRKLAKEKEINDVYVIDADNRIECYKKDNELYKLKAFSGKMVCSVYLKS
jgi:hypothetical protein